MAPESNLLDPVARARRRLFIWAIVLVVLTLLSGAWLLLPIRELIHPQAWFALLRSFAEHPVAPWVALAGFLVGSLLVLPVTVMVVLTVATFGPLMGFFYALAGVTIAGLSSFALGRRLGRAQLDRLAGTRLHAVSLRLRGAGITTVAAIRMIPITHFTVVSLAAGVSHIRVRDFLMGTVIGMAPGIGAIAIFFDQFSAMAQSPTLEHLLWLLGISLAILAALLYFRRLAGAKKA